MKIDRAGYPFIAAALVPAAVLAASKRHGLAASFALLGGFLTYFFRDPDRTIPADADAVVSPADGRVMIAGPSDGRWAPPGDWKQITIFLSPMDVHVNRIPVSGRVIRVEYHPGRFLPAYKKESGDLNERSEITIDHDGQPIIVRQIVGVLARRVICRAREGLEVKAGERFGIMKFGSRMDVFLPLDATLHVRVGDTVLGGVTVIATLTASGAKDDKTVLEAHDAR